MKKVLLATTALFALSGISVAAADVSISGHVRYHYDSWSDDKKDDGNTANGNNNNSTSGDLQLWVKGKTVADSGLTYEAAVRFRDKGEDAASSQNNVDRRYLTISDDWGSLTLGRDWSPTYSMSLASDWRGTIAYGGGDAVTNGTMIEDTFVSASTSGNNDKVAYRSPDISGFKFGLAFADAGKTSKANSTEYALQYGMSAFGDGMVKVGYNAASQSAATSADDATETDKSELGVEVTSGAWTASAVQFTKKSKPKVASAAMKDEHSGQEVEVAYKASDSLTVNLVYFKSQADEGANKNDDYKWTGVGAKYSFAPGLYTSIGYKNFDYTDKDSKTLSNSGNTIRLRVHAGF